MLANIRKNKKLFSIPIWIVAGSFVLTIFLVWGRGSVSGPGINDVATVNGKPIQVTDFYRTVDSLTSSGLSKKQAESEALKRLLLRTLLLDAAEKEGFKVSDWAIAQRIASFPVFQKNGTFSKKLYKSWLKQNRLNPETFEKEVKNDLLIEKLQTIVESTPYVTDKEAKLFYKTAFGKRKYEYQIFKTDTNSVKINRKEINEFYNKNKGMFMENKEEIKVVEIPKDRKDGKDLVKKAYKLAKEKKLAEFKELPVKTLKDSTLLKEIEKNNEEAGYMEEGNTYIVYSRKKRSKTIPLKKVEKEIVEILKEEKGNEITLKKAEEAIKSGKLTKPKITKETSGSTLVKEIGLMDLNGAITTQIVKAPTNKIIGPFKATNGYVLIKPLNEIKVEKYEEDKIKTVKEFLAAEKKKASFQSYVQFLQNKAKIQVNQKFFQENKL